MYYMYIHAVQHFVNKLVQFCHERQSLSIFESLATEMGFFVVKNEYLHSFVLPEALK
jgi:hypothetical protein